MNEKDYKEIAIIMKLSKSEFKAKKKHRLRCVNLADYFEEGDELQALRKCDEHIIPKGYWKRYSRFNSKQFLKDCGIEVK